ncbi:Nonribosomal peptide synthetase 2 [Sphaceloma murrayae]|uniref:Nonribosomal peptide synthetase 2 n=1 Tax=Sphaceloma murrayae TaxID=2082308 RepID=A0A2K1QQ50_9PEZI|nr:Nonribosomal peptide synthetase 2 [Sphaceloma murrayae]
MATDAHDRLSVVNPSPAFLDGPDLLHHLIADETTDAIALEYHDSNGLALQLSYQQLHHRAARLAHTLSRRRGGATDRPSITPLLIPQSAALYISQIAILKSGSAFCPLNLDVPEERLKFILQDVAATVVLTTPEYKDKFNCLPDLVVLVLDGEGNLLQPGDDGPDNGTSARNVPPSSKDVADHDSGMRIARTTDPAYIMYTSGSTGTPKAVILSHRAVTQSLLAHDRFIPAFSRFLQFANPTFDVSVFEIYFPFFRKATLVSCDRTYLLSDLSNVVTQLNVDGAELTPSVVASLVRSRNAVPKLRTLLTIGEMLNPQTVREFAGTSSDDSLLYGMYGPTEAAIHCTLQPSFKQSDTVNTIGVPLDTVSCFVIKPTEECSAPDDVQIVPQGEVGELAVGGHQLADGYLNREEQTKAVFINHSEYGPLYRTGDKAKLTERGLLECLGRISKGQVKLRGQRIELGEIEHAASNLQGVHAASASVIDGQLVLFAVADESQVKRADIEDSCRKWLPRYMVPNDIVILKDFPYLPSGKTDSKKLDADYRTSIADSLQEETPKVADNRKLLEILRLSVNKAIKPTSNLASAGLDSLRAIKLATELRRHGYPQLSAVDLLRCTTVKDLDALVIKSSTSSAIKSEQVDVDFAEIQRELRQSLDDLLGDAAREVSDVFPCTPLQDAMLVETAKNPEAYYNSATLTLPHSIDTHSLHATFRQVAEQHISLRSGFVQSPHQCSAFTQIVWSSIQDAQFGRTAGSETAFAASDQINLLRPLLIHVQETTTPPRIVIQLHHALYDQWSLDILVDDLYRAIQHQPIPQRPSFATVSQTALEMRASRKQQSTLNAFWRSYLSGATFTKLPNLTGRTSTDAKLAISRRKFQIKPTQLSRLASRYKTSESAIFQTAYGYLLSLYVGQSDITFGAVFSGRTAAIDGVQDIFGPMLSTLPTRLTSAGVRRFKDLVKATQNSNLDIMANTDLPLINIKRAASIDPSTSLFDSIFVWQGSPRESVTQVEVQLVDTTDYVEFDLTLDVEPSKSGYVVKATYRQNILPKPQIEFFLDQLDLILTQVVDFPECRLNELFVDVHPQDCMSIFNPLPAQLECGGGLTRMMDDSIRQFGDRPAICFANQINENGIDQESLTYSELSVRANQLAHYMLAEDLQPGGLVCIVMEKSVNLYISILAAIKAGCGYLPIVPSTPIHRIGKILADAPITFTMCDLQTAEILAALSISELHIVENVPFATLSRYRPRIIANLQDVAYAVYTSGTTGTPKGVLVTHENICSNLKVLGGMYPKVERGRLLQVCNQAFDVSVFEIFYAWTQGMCLCSAGNDVLFRDLELSIRKFGVTHLSMTPTVAALVKRQNIPSVQFLVTSGEPLSASVHRNWAGKHLYQGYGPSETTNICTVNACMPLDDSINNIGPSFANTSTFVLPQNGDFAPLPRGALGELCFGGQQVFKGYQNMPDLTASKIINHPKYGRIYRSGDLGRMASDGSILIEGRTDTQRKIRGQRIELGEVIHALIGCKGVLDATALVAGGQGAETLVAFWIPDSTSRPKYSILDADQQVQSVIAYLRKTLEAVLPSYMVPSFFVPISALPMTSQSKIDINRLIEDFGDLPEAYLEGLADIDHVDDGEWSETDQAIRQILAQTLGTQESSIHRNTSLFGLGLDSLSAIRLASSFKKQLGTPIDVSTILKRSRLALLSEFVQERDQFEAKTNGQVSPLEKFKSKDQIAQVKSKCAERTQGVHKILPCTPLQEAMLSASISQGSSAYLNRNVLTLRAPSEALKAAWTRMIQRHEILRTMFFSTDDVRFPFVQAVLGEMDVPWYDQSGSMSPNELLYGLPSEVAAAVDSNEVPFRLTHYKGSEEDFLVIDMHHALYDANAMSILLEDVERSQRSEELPASVTFDTFLEHMLHKDEGEADAFFDTMLLKFKPQEFPGVSINERSFSAQHLVMEVPADQMHSFQKKYSVSMLALVQAAWSQVLSVLQDTSDLCFGNVVSGRTVPVEGVERLVAPCFNTLPVRASMNDLKDNLELVQHLHRLNVDSLAYQLTPLRRTQQRLQSGLRLFDSLVLLQQDEQHLDPSIWTFNGEKGDMDFPCIIEVVPDSGYLRVSLHFQRNLFSDSSAAASVDKSDDSWTDVEASIRDTFLSVSNAEVKNLNKHTTIYRMGLDSISAIQAANRLKSQGFSISAMDILEHPTPSELAEFIEAAASQNHIMGKPGIDFASFDEKHRSDLAVARLQKVRPCTAVQSGMLTAFIRSRGRDYLNHFAYKVDPTINAADLINSWRIAAAANEMLRTGFVEVEDPQYSFAMVTFEVEETSTPTEIVEGPVSLDSLTEQNSAEIFDDFRTPAWRCKIIRSKEDMTMLISMHHALYDAASLSQMLGQVTNTLKSSARVPPASMELALNHILSNSGTTDDRKSFWTQALRAVNPSRFPNLHPVIPNLEGVLDVHLEVSRPRSELEALCSAQGISLQAVFQAAWARLLSAYTGEEQVTFGIVHSGRVSDETQNACFPCINTLPLTCNAGTSSNELLKKLVDYNAGVQKHCYTPLADIQQWLGLQNEALFDTIFAFQKPLTDAGSAWDLVYEKAAVDYSVSIEVEHLTGDTLRLRTTFESTILPEEQAHAMLRHLETLALELLNDTTTLEQRSRDLAIVPAKDPVIHSNFTLLHQMVDQAVKEHPDRPALEFISSIEDDVVQRQSWTFKQLDQKADCVAHLLHNRGVKPGSVVGLCFDKCPEAAFAFLGILKAGCCILAIDSTAPLARKEFIMSDSSASAILCSQQVADELASTDDVIILNLALHLDERLPSKPLKTAVDQGPHSLSYILYTSGTTGTPKGCEITHENAVQALLAFQRLFKGRWTEKSVWLQFASYHFDVAILEHFWTWSVGMKMLCAPRDLILEDIASFIDRFQITHLDLTPSLGRLLDPATVPSLHSGVFITGGEAVKPEMLRTWGDIGCLFNFYGPTETTIGVTTFPSVPTNGKAANIGWQFDNVGTCVLKPATQEPVFRGGVGELCIFGKLVGKGYLNRPDLNSDRFPHIDNLGERIYRTGDLVRLLHDNSFEFLGRADSQVKLRGQRLEIDEIVTVILGCEAIEDAVCVVARQEVQQKDQLVAFVTPSSDRKQGQPALYENSTIDKMISQAKTACEDRLPVYMVPTHFIPIHFVPLSVNNKQDDKALKQFYQSLSTTQLQQLSLSCTEQRELNDIERVIVASLSATLGTDLDEVKPDANLFALGMSSISAVQLSRRLKSTGYPKVNISMVMQNATISKLARVITDSASSGADSEVLAAKQSIAACQQRYLGQVAQALSLGVQDIEKLAPCTPLQQGILFRSQSTEDGLYFNRFLFDVQVANLGRLRKAFEQLIRSTEILRVAFVETEDGHVQVVRKTVDLDWQETAGSDEVLEDRRQEWIARNDRGLFYPLSVTIATGAQSAKMQVCIHHALYDGNSWGLLVEKLTSLYHGNIPQEAAPFFDVLGHGPLRSSKQARDFWLETLQSTTFEPMQEIANEPSEQDILVTKSISGIEKLDSLRRDLQVTPQALVQAVWLATLSTYHAGPVGLIVSGRSMDIDAEGVIGPLFNTIPFGWSIGDKESWTSFCRRCHDFNLATMPYQHTPLRDITKWLGKSSADPLFETLFVFQQPTSQAGDDNDVLSPIEDQNYMADYPLSFEAELSHHGSLTVTLGAQGHYFDRARLEAMVSQFEANFASFTKDPQAIIALSNSYKEKIRTGSSSRDLPDANGYHGTFEWASEASIVRKEMAMLASIDVKDIDEHTSIFAIGLDSIDAVKLSARLKKHGILVPVSALMRSQTIPKILGQIKKATSNDDTLGLDKTREAQREILVETVKKSLPVKGPAVEEILAATPMQEALISEMLRSGHTAYFNHDVLQLEPDVDISKLERAWEQVIEANPILRTAFVPIEDPNIASTFAQVVLKLRSVMLDRVTIAEKDDIDKLLQRVTADVKRDGTLTVPLRLTLATQSRKQYLILSIAHALYDGYSLGLLHSDVAMAYHSEAPKRPSYIPAVEKALLSIGSSAISFWESLLVGVTPSQIATSGPTTPTTHRAEIASSLTASTIKAFCRANDITPQALCQTAWALHLAFLTHSLDVTYGLVLAGRDGPEAEEVMFPTMNTVVSRNVVHGTGRDMIKEMQEQLLSVRDFQGTPLRQILQIIKRVGRVNEGPGVIDALFTFQKNSERQSGGKLYESVSGASEVEHAVAVEAEICGEDLVWRNAVRSSVGEEKEIQDMLHQIDGLLSKLVNQAGDEILTFEAGKVSVLGQQPFELVKSTGETKGTETVISTKNEKFTEVETKIRDVVAHLAKVPAEEIAKTTRLDNLGIDSISAIKLASLLKKQGITLAVSKIIRAGTIESMASLVKTSANNDEHMVETDHCSALITSKGISASSLGLNQDTVESILPITAGQTYMLATWAHSEGKLFYPTFTYTMSGNVTDYSINVAWKELVTRNSILRTSFIATKQEDLPFVQVVLKNRNAELRPRTNEQFFANLDVARQGGRTLLKLSIHHALYDAVSLQLLMRELEDLLNGKSSLPAPISFSTFISPSVATTSKSKQEAFWKSYLSDLPTSLALATKYAGGKTEVFTPEAHAVSTANEAKLRRAGVSLQALFFAIYAQVHARTYGKDNDVSLGVYLANRSSESSERLLAPTVNLLPLRARCPSRTKTVDVARQIQEDIKRISEEDVAGAALWEIQKWTGITADVFVNFIKLPEEDDISNEDDGRIKITSVDIDEEHEFKERAKVVPIEDEASFELPKELIGANIGGAYPPSVDIEATVRDGKLAVGVFGFESVIGLERAQDIVEGIKQGMGEYFDVQL